MCLGAALVALPACSKVLGIGDFSLAPDGAVDAPGPDAQLCYGAGLAPICLTSPPAGAVTLDLPLDTSMATTCTEVIAQTAAGAPELCVIAATAITVSATVTVSGPRPLMLLATDTISIGGTLDVSSRRSPARVGPGGNFACAAGTAPANNTTAAAGGAGGTFGTKGANGGDGNSGGVATANGVSPAVVPLTFVRGGCKGQDGGDVSATVQGGLGGAGGGAVYLYAGTSIEIAGNIFASGAGATATGLHAGGGGGGAGGLIGLEAPTITLGGILAANGANGGAGSGTTTVGAAGTDGATITFSTQPAGTTNASSGGAGGRGATGLTAATIAGNGAVSGAAGGGGGGGFGIIWVKGTFTGTQVSPAITQN